MKRIAAAAVAAALVVTALLPAFAAAAGNTVTVSVAIGPRAQVTRVDDGLIVRSNTDWRVVVTAENGTTEYAGEKTNGEKLAIPSDTTGYWVVAE